MPAILLRELQATTAQLRRLTVQQNRFNLDRARHDTRDWVQERRARTRQLIELGGLVQKAGLVELVDDDRATLLGALLEIAGWLQEDEHQEEATNLKVRWRRRGLHAFDADKAAPGIENEGQPGKETPP
jgi:hypothetical protein